MVARSPVSANRAIVHKVKVNLGVKRKAANGLGMVRGSAQAFRHDVPDITMAIDIMLVAEDDMVEINETSALSGPHVHRLQQRFRQAVSVGDTNDGSHDIHFSRRRNFETNCFTTVDAGNTMGGSGEAICGLSN